MSPDRSLTKLRDNPELQKRLLKYSAAAGLAVAAGLVLPARPGHADPGITCVDENPDKEVTTGGSYSWSFDGDNDDEFIIAFSGGGGVRLAFQPPNPSDAGLRVISAMGSVSMLSTSDSVSSAGGNWGTADYFITWPDQGFKYMGLEFNLDGGGPHYAWVRLSVAAGSASFTVDKYCYDTTPGQGIHVGTTEPPPPSEPVGGYVAPVNRLGLLAPWLGTAAAALAGLTAWWRRQLARRGE